MDGLPPLSPKKVLRFKDEEEPPTRTRTSRLPSLQRRASLMAYDPIIATFVKNGDKFFEGVKLNITQRNMRNWDTLLAELSRKIELPAGVRHIYTPEGGHRVKSLSQLEHQKTYVCGSSEPFKKMDYTKVRNPDWRAASKVRVSDAGLYSRSVPPDLNGSLSASVGNSMNESRNWTEAGLDSSMRRKRFFSQRRRPMRLSSISEPQEVMLSSSHRGSSLIIQSPSALPEASKPLILTVIRNGPPPRQNVTIYLHKNSIRSWEEAKDLISENLRTTNGCLCLFQLDGKEVLSLSQLWRAGNTLIATGNEKFNIVEFLMAASGKGYYMHPCINY